MLDMQEFIVENVGNCFEKADSVFTLKRFLVDTGFRGYDNFNFIGRQAPGLIFR